MARPTEKAPLRSERWLTALNALERRRAEMAVNATKPDRAEIGEKPSRNLPSILRNWKFWQLLLLAVACLACFIASPTFLSSATAGSPGATGAPGASSAGSARITLTIPPRRTAPAASPQKRTDGTQIVKDGLTIIVVPQ